MVGKNKMKKKGVRFWRRKKKADDAEDLIETDYAPPTLSRTHVKKQQSNTSVEDSIDTNYKTSQGRIRKYKTVGKHEPQHRQQPHPQQPVVADFDPIEDVSYKHNDTYKTKKLVGKSSSIRTPSQKIKISDSFTPKTVGSATLTPSPTKWQEAKKDAKLQHMARLHNLSKAHTGQSPPNKKKHRKIPNMTPRMIPPLDGNERDDLRGDGIGSANDKKFIDRVLGVSPGCVPTDTATAIKGYASKPTSPTTVVNFAMLKKGSIRVAELAKDSMRQLMTCAADLNDIHQNSEIRKDLCYAFDQNADFYNDGETYDEDDETYDTYERWQRGRSRNRRQYYQTTVENGDDGTFTGNSLNFEKERGSSHSGSELTQDEENESLGEIMDRVLKGDQRKSYNEPETEPHIQVQNQVMEQSDESESPIARLRELSRTSSRASKIHKAASQTSGLTSFRDYASMSSSHSSTISPKRVSQRDLAMADPITKDVPFDERTQSELRRNEASLPLPSPSDTHNFSIGGDLKDNRLDKNALQHQSIRSERIESKPDGGRKYSLRFEDESFDVSEGEI